MGESSDIHHPSSRAYTHTPGARQVYIQVHHKQKKQGGITKKQDGNRRKKKKARPVRCVFNFLADDDNDDEDEGD